MVFKLLKFIFIPKFVFVVSDTVRYIILCSLFLSETIFMNSTDWSHVLDGRNCLVILDNVCMSNVR